MAGTEVMVGVGASMKDPLPTEKSPSDRIQTPEKRQEKTQSLDSRSSHQDDEKSTDSPNKNKTGTPKKPEVARNVFAGARPSPKKNPWTRNAPSEGGKEGTREGVAGGGVASMGSEVTGEGKGIEIPKGEVSPLEQRTRDLMPVCVEVAWGVVCTCYVVWVRLGALGGASCVIDHLVDRLESCIRVKLTSGRG